MNCLITGASVGIGKALAYKMGSLGYNLFLTYYSNQKLCEELKQELINKYGIECYTSKCDLHSEEEIKNIILKFKDKFGSMDILVNNASISHDSLIEDKTKEEFMDVLEVNVLGTFLMSKYAVSIMNKNGVIINMSSTDGIDTYSLYNIDYSVSKAGIIQLTKVLSLVYNDIRTIAVAPNWVETESTLEMNQDYLKSELERIGQNKLIEKEKVIQDIIHIIVDKSIKSGSIIRIDGE